MTQRKKVAVVGGGVAGIVSSYLLEKCADVTLFEAAQYLGGHTNTVTLLDGPDRGVAIDTGFIVLNDKNYPLFHRFLAALDVPWRWSDMSFAYYSERTGFRYAGTTLNGLFADRVNLVRPGFYRFLNGIVRFCSVASRRLKEGSLAGVTLREFIAQEEIRTETVDGYLLPMGAAIWSAPHDRIMDFPAESLFAFFDNHGLLGLRDRPRWQTVVGGSSRYVDRFRERFGGTIRLATPIAAITRTPDGIEIIAGPEQSRLRFDAVVVATHADQALRLLHDPSDDERRLLGAWRYERNHTVLHRDTAVLAPERRAWASWNYVEYRDIDRTSPVPVTYHMNRLQGLRCSHDYCVTLNGRDRINSALIIKEFTYEHPTYDGKAVETQGYLPGLNGQRSTFFCGSYFGHGFHEDAVRSAVEVGRLFGVEL